MTNVTNEDAAQLERTERLGEGWNVGGRAGDEWLSEGSGDAPASAGATEQAAAGDNAVAEAEKAVHEQYAQAAAEQHAEHYAQQAVGHIVEQAVEAYETGAMEPHEIANALSHYGPGVVAHFLQRWQEDVVPDDDYEESLPPASPAEWIDEMRGRIAMAQDEVDYQVAQHRANEIAGVAYEFQQKPGFLNDADMISAFLSHALPQGIQTADEMRAALTAGMLATKELRHAAREAEVQAGLDEHINKWEDNWLSGPPKQFDRDKAMRHNFLANINPERAAQRPQTRAERDTETIAAFDEMERRRNAGWELFDRIDTTERREQDPRRRR